MSKVKTNPKLNEATRAKSDAGKAGFRPSASEAGGRKPPPGSREAAQEECDRANVPVINASDFEKAHKAGAFSPDNIRRAVAGEPLVLKGSRPEGDPWDGKKRLDAGERMLRCVLTTDEIEARKSELLDMHAQTPALRTAVSDAKKVLKDTNNELAAHEAKIETHAEATKRGWINRPVECITVLETRRGMPLRVCYRTDTGEEAIPAKEASLDDVQESVPGA